MKEGAQKPPQVEVVTYLVFARNEWSLDNNSYWLTIESHSDGKLDERHSYVGNLANLADVTFIDLWPDPLANPWALSALEQNYLPVHWFLKIPKQAGATLELARFDNDWWRELLKKKPRSLRHEFPYGKDGLVVLTDSPKAMQRFLQRHAGDPRAFTMTSFFRNGGDRWPVEDLRSVAQEMIDDLDRSEIPKKLGKDKAFIQVSEIVNRTSEPIDTKFIDVMLLRRLNDQSHFRTLNNSSYLDPDFAREVAAKMADVNLTGVITKASSQDAGQETTSYSLHLSLRNREGTVLWESERPLPAR